ncbi:MAG: NACHT domain-containing protein [Chloroflexales bacterium]|nr:NACHT domain-containing protein [Chloroflexales bacterium]
MATDDECAQLGGRLQTNRDRLHVLLGQQDSFGVAFAPPHISVGIREARGTIAELKARLHSIGCPAEDRPEDADPAAPPPPRDDLSPGVEVFEQHPRFCRFLRTPRLASLIETVAATPCYHIIEAPMGHGKTALAGELWRTLAGGDHTRLAYLFSRDHGRTRVSQAVRSLYRQLRAHGAQKAALPEEDTALTTSALYSASRHGARLFIILDGLDECDDAERPLLGQLLPDGLVPNVTIVITLRPSVRQLLLQHLSRNHMLQDIELPAPGQGALLHRLEPLAEEEIRGMLLAAGHGDDPDLARRIFDHSQGLPMVAVPYLEHPQLLDDARAGAIPVDAYYERALRLIKAQCPEAHHEVLARLLALLAAARSPLADDDLARLLEVPRATIVAMRGILARYQHLDEEGVMALDRHFRAYLARADETRAAVREADARLMAWVVGFTATASLAEVPLYALRHAAEHLALGPGLRYLLARTDWFGELERRCQSRSACIETLKRAQDEIDRHFTGAPGDPAVVAMLLCALVRASLGATLLPELVAQLVRLGLWGEAEALDYAENYVSQANRQALRDLLARPAQPLSFPAGSAVAEAAQILRRYVMLPPAARQLALAGWRRTYEQAGGDAGTQGDRDRLALLVAALQQPALSGGERATWESFDSLLSELYAYHPPLTGPMSDPQFASLLGDLADAWWQLHPRDAHRYWLQPIVAALSRFARSDLIEALELLAPTLRTLFPECVAELCAALDQVGQAIM